jgi:hypothetical protein
MCYLLSLHHAWGGSSFPWCWLESVVVPAEHALDIPGSQLGRVPRFLVSAMLAHWIGSIVKLGSCSLLMQLLLVSQVVKLCSVWLQEGTHRWFQSVVELALLVWRQSSRFFRFPEFGQYLVGGSDDSRYGDMSCCSDSSLSTWSEWSRMAYPKTVFHMDRKLLIRYSISFLFCNLVWGYLMNYSWICTSSFVRRRSPVLLLLYERIPTTQWQLSLGCSLKQ